METGNWKLLIASQKTENLKLGLGINWNEVVYFMVCSFH